MLVGVGPLCDETGGIEFDEPNTIKIKSAVSIFQPILLFGGGG